MSLPGEQQNPFDEYAASYEQDLGRGLSASGESAEFFARERIAWLPRVLRRVGFEPHRVLDFGCGIGMSVPHLAALDGVEVVYAADPSERSLEVAREMHWGDRVEFVPWNDLPSVEPVDLVFSNGVLHHVPPDSRALVLRQVRNLLRPGGLLAVWDNNPWSPAARYVMSRIPFDKDAVLVWPAQVRRALREEGFTPLRTDFRFIFPRFLSLLRPLEALVAPMPLGAQYQILARADPSP